MDRDTTLGTVEACRIAADRARATATRTSTQLQDAMVAAARSGASQREIATGAGVSQPYVAKVLAKSRISSPHSGIASVLAAKRPDVLRLLGEHGVTNVEVFGSVANGTDGPDSDLDLLADIPVDVGLLGLARLEDKLADLLEVDVDLVPRRLLKPAVRETVTKTVRL